MDLIQIDENHSLRTEPNSPQTQDIELQSSQFYSTTISDNPQYQNLEVISEADLPQNVHHGHQNCRQGQHQNVIPTSKTGFVMTIEDWNIWLCAPQDATIVGFVLVYFGLLTLYFYFILPDGNTNIGYINLFCVFLHYYMFILGVTTEPGVVPRNTQAIPEETDTIISFDHPVVEEQTKLCQLENDSKQDPGAFFRERYCRTCYIIRPPKASHCSTCGNCVKGFDHHCSFLGNCVGERNLKYFFGWLCSMCLQGVLYFYVSFPLFYQQISESKVMVTILASTYVKVFLFAFIYCFLHTLFCMRRRQRGPAIICLGVMLIIQCCFYYDFEITYKQNFVSTLVFLIFTVPVEILYQYFMIFSVVPLTLQYVWNITKGVTEKEKQVIKKMNQEGVNRNTGGISNLFTLFFKKTPDSEIFR